MDQYWFQEKVLGEIGRLCDKLDLLIAHNNESMDYVRSRDKENNERYERESSYNHQRAEFNERWVEEMRAQKRAREADEEAHLIRQIIHALQQVRERHPEEFGEWAHISESVIRMRVRKPEPGQRLGPEGEGEPLSDVHAQT